MRFTVLDSWRGICALWVAVYHFRVADHFHQLKVFNHGNLAVEFFFVLSGFVLASAYGDRLNSNRARSAFLLRRVGRLYPLHLATLAVVVAMEVARALVAWRLGRDLGGPPFQGETDLTTLLPNALLVHGLGFIPEFTWNIPSWSISVEFALCILLLISLISPRRLAVAMIGATGGLLAYLFTRYGVSDPVESTTALSRGVYAFFVGVLVFRVYAWLKSRNFEIGAVRWLELAAVPLFFLAPYVDHSPLPVVMFAFLILVFAFEAGPVSVLMKRRWLERLGEVSYSIYLVHYPLVLGIFGAATVLGQVSDIGGAPWLTPGSPWLGDLLTLVYVAIVIAISTVTFRVIEAPARGWFNRHARALELQPDRPAVPSTRS